MDGTLEIVARRDDSLVSVLCLSIARLQDECDGWRELALSRDEDNQVLRQMVSELLAVTNTRERAEAARTGRVIRLLDDLPHVRQSVAKGFTEEAERLREELLEHTPV
jgi:hypothetical protein